MTGFRRSGDSHLFQCFKKQKPSHEAERVKAILSFSFKSFSFKPFSLQPLSLCCGYGCRCPCGLTCRHPCRMT